MSNYMGNCKKLTTDNVCKCRITVERATGTAKISVSRSNNMVPYTANKLLYNVRIYKYIMSGLSGIYPYMLGNAYIFI